MTDLHTVALIVGAVALAAYLALYAGGWLFARAPTWTVDHLVEHRPDVAYEMHVRLSMWTESHLAIYVLDRGRWYLVGRNTYLQAVKPRLVPRLDRMLAEARRGRR